MALLALSLFGGFEATLGGMQVTTFESDKVRALLAYLAVERARPQRRETLAGRLWPNMPDRDARTNLRHVLADLRKVLGDRVSPQPLLLTSRQTIQFNVGSDYLLDVQTFSDAIAETTTHQHTAVEDCETCIARLREAAALYKGDFLAGFSLASDLFETWVTTQREKLHIQALNVLDHLATHHEQRSDHAQVVRYAQRQVELEPWRESAHRQWMRALACSGQRGMALAQYETCRRILETELGIEPTEETTALYEHIRSTHGRSPQTDPSTPPHFPPSTTPRLPPFLTKNAPQIATEQPIFVGREPELTRLDIYLDKAMIGQGQVALINGGPGRGKTALMHAFAQRAMAAHPDLLVANGTCNAFAGIGDPYLPFREILTFLTGDVESHWAAGTLSRDHAQRVWSALPKTLPSLVRQGPDLIGTLLPRGELLLRAEQAASDGADWARELWTLAEGPRATGLQQLAIFQQVTNVLKAIAQEHPLLVLLDDLQWADTGSIGMLFHLGRRLAGSRILVLGAYRPEEIAMGRGREQNTLQNVLDEFQRHFGDVGIDLRQADTVQGHKFVNALVDAEPNRLNETFRSALTARTGGHPLFTVELLRAMQASGDLVCNAEGAWIEGTEINWETLPARVEAVMGARLGRLSAEQRDLLAVASVEGETFTAQVIAYVQDLDEREVLQALSWDLATHHRLVREVEEVHINGQYLSRYQFTHALFQDYLYRELGDGERRLLHGEVAIALENAYGEQPADIAAQLAYHYDRAGHIDKTVEYALQAGEHAHLTYANEEAIGYYQRVLALLDGTTPNESRNNWRFEALHKLGKLYNHVGRSVEAERSAREALALGKKTGVAARTLVHIHFWLGEALFWQGRHDEMVHNGQEGLALLEGDIESVEGALMNTHIAAGHKWSGNLPKYLQTAFQMAQFVQNLPFIAELGTAYNYIIASYGDVRNIDLATKWCHICLERANEINDLGQQAHALRMLSSISGVRGDLHKYLSLARQAVELYARVGDTKNKASAIMYMGQAFTRLGRLQQAEIQFQQSLAIAKTVLFKRDIVLNYINIGIVSLCQHEWERAIDLFQKVLSLDLDPRKTWSSIPFLHYYLGRAYQAQGNKVAAARQFQQAIEYLSAQQAPNIADVLSALEQVSPSPDAFHAFCRRFRQAHPELGTQLSQWFLEAADVRLLPRPSLHDDFKDNLAPGWTWHDQFEDCTYTVHNGLLIYTANGRALSHLNFSAPRILRWLPSVPDNNKVRDLVVQTVCIPAEDARPTIGGLTLWRDKENYLRLERGVFGKRDISFMGYVDNRAVVVGRGLLPIEETSGRVFLRMAWKGTRLDAYCSADGEQWFSVGHTKFPGEDPVQVGLHAIGAIGRAIYHGAYPEGTAIRFTSFQLWESTE